MTRLLMLSSGVLLSILLSQADGHLCNDNLLTYENIEYLSTNCTANSCVREFPREVTYFFPTLTISCNGSIVNWTAAGNLEYGDVVTNPSLILWRLNPQNSSQYILRQQKIPLTQCNGKRLIQNSLQIYTCELEDELPVQEGDVLGMEIPSYEENYVTFEPYFDRDSDRLPLIYFHRGTTITKFIMSSRRTARALPLVSVGVVPIDFNAEDSFPELATQTLQTTREDITSSIFTTNGTTMCSQGIQLGVWEISGVAAGVAVLLIFFFVVIAIQCFIILKHRRKVTNLKDGTHSEYSGEPYAIIEMTSISDSYGLPKQPIMEDTELILISKNPSYVKSSNMSPPNLDDSMYMVPNDITMTESPQIILGELEPNTSEVHNTEERYTTKPLSPHSTDHSYNSTSSLLRADDEELNYTTIEEMRKPEETDIVVQLHQPQSPHITVMGNRGFECDTSEPIYY